MDGIRKLIFKSLKIRGLSITSDATEALLSVLSREDDVEGSLKLILDELKDRIDKQEVKSTIIDMATIEKIVADLSASEEDLALESFQLLDAYTSPKLHYEEKTRQYKVVSMNQVSLVASLDARTALYRERLILTQQRLLRSELFTLRTRNRNISDTDELSTIESLLGSQGTKVLLGFLSQLAEGEWCLEDLTGMIKLDLSQAMTYPLFYTEGSIVVVQGQRSDNNIFIVQVMGLPPAEERSTTLKAINMLDTFGSQGFTNAQHYLQMQLLEENSTSQLVVILSDMHLDRPLVLEKFQQILEGFEANGVDPLYILIGSFLSKSLYFTTGGKQAIKSAFQALADTISKVPRQRAQAKFLIIPGPLDAGINVALPRKSLPPHLVAPLKEQVAHVSFGSNPCRLRCFTQEIVIFRYDLLKKMQRHLVVPLKTPFEFSADEEKEGLVQDQDETHIKGHQLSQQPSPQQEAVPDSVPEVTEQLVESILDQAHLCPLPALASPVYWELDHTMRLVPLPHLLILADQTEQFSYEYKGCHAVNPGAFSHDFSFIVYQPSSQTIQFSRVPS